ncbi:MAG: IPTL-CTERM sorting domain-containing protein [Xanthomonadales bacterium]|nr:IPTL-CTERM sorting domain-containing protein [Xanthomonadales bacterium]
MKKLLFTALVLVGTLIAAPAQAQTPNISNGTPEESFLGEQFCFNAQFTNAGAPGYGPYMQLVIAENLSFNSAEIFNSSAEISNEGVFAPPPNNQLTDPVSGLPVTGPEGGSLTIIKLPVGSVVTGGPDLTTNICLTIEPAATAGIPHDVTLVPVYEFGNTPTGVNGPIVGPENTKPVIPTIIRFEKANVLPEEERPPSTTWPFSYTLTADIANTATVENLEFSDTLPADIQYMGPVEITGGSGCAVTATPSTNTPGGTLVVECDSATGTLSSSDVTVSFQVYATQILDANSCAVSLQTNNATLDVDYLQAPLGQLLADSTMTVEHLSLQKGASQEYGIPGDTITYSLDFQIRDQADVSNLVVTDTLPDGTAFAAHGTLVVAGSTVAISPVTVSNGDGTTTVTYDIGAVAPVIGAGTAISLNYTAVIQPSYVETGLPVHANDSLHNTVEAVYNLVNGATGCVEGSGATVSIVPVSLTKTIVNPQPYYVPGEKVTYRLTLQVPSGDTREIELRDALPLPVFKVSDIDTTWNNDIRPGPNHLAGLVPDSINANSATNSIVINWPDITEDTPSVIQVDIDALVTDDPFADNLYLTNIAESSTQNTPGVSSDQVAPIQIRVGAPELVLTKGISSSSNPNSVIDPAPSVLPVDGNIGNSDANDILTYVLTVENIGSASAFDVLVQETVPSGLTNCALGTVLDGNGTAIPTSGDLFGAGLLISQLTMNDANPAGGGAPYGTDTALVTFTCALDIGVQPGQVIDNTAGASWRSQTNSTPFPPVTDNATATIANANASKLFVVTSETTTSDSATPPRATIGEIVRYRLIAELPEGTVGELKLADVLPAGLTFLDDGSSRAAFISNGPGLNASGVSGIPNIPGNDPSLAAVPSNLLTFALPGSAISPASFGPGTDPVFSFGSVTNSDNDDDAEFLLVEINALANNSTNNNGTPRNNSGNNRDNRVEIFNGEGSLDTSANVRVRIAEPALTTGKTANPATGDAGDLITFTLEVSNASGNNVSHAYDVIVTDPLDARLIDFSISSVTPAACPDLGAVDNSTATQLSFSFQELAPGCLVTIVYTAKLDASVAPGTSIVNTATSEWTSLPGTNGTTSNPTGSSTPGASGNESGERNGNGAGANDYKQSDDATVNVLSLVLSKIVTGTSQPSTGKEQDRQTIDDLTIGETVDFEIVATIPEGTTPLVVLSDTMPYTNGVMEMISASVVSVGANLTPANNLLPPYEAVLTDEQLADSINDSVSFDFGQVINSADGVTDENDQIRLAVKGRLLDLTFNGSGDRLTNTALVQFGSGLSASANAETDTVAPDLSLIKSGDISQGDAGDTVTFTLTLSHAASSTADAFDVLLSDTLPEDLVLVPASFTHESGLAPDSLAETANGIEATWSTFGLTASSVFTVKATIANTVMPAEVLTNTATADWDSLPGDTEPHDRPGSVSGSHSITATAPGVVKVITATSEADTGSGQFGPETDLTIGEEVTYQFTVTLPEGTTNSAVVTDQLPTGSSVLQVVSSRFVAKGDNISGAGLPAPGTPGSASDTNADSFDDRVTWTLGTLLNTPDGSTTEDDRLTFEVVAVVLDQAANQSGVVTQTNTASLASETSTVSGTVDVDLVAPAVSVTKVVSSPLSGFADAGDTVIHTLTIDHGDASTADAYNITLIDTLPDPGLQWVNDTTVSSDCPGLLIDSNAAPLIEFTVPHLTLVADSCTISYETLVDASVQPAEQLTNVAEMDYSSTPAFTAGETRTLSDSGTAEVTVIAPTLVKLATLSSLQDTALNELDPALVDLAIGETITYSLTVVAPEGVVSDVTVTDLLPASDVDGFMEVIGANVSAVGGQITTTEPGTPVFDDFQNVDGINDRVVFNFGTVTNTPDNTNDAEDMIVMQVVARVVDTPFNSEANVLVNHALVDFRGGQLTDTADVEIVEPSLSLSKAMGPVVNSAVRITLTVENTGTAPAYDISVSDVLDHSVWNAAALSPVSVSTGFLLESTPGPAADQTTITFSTDPLATSPAGSIPVGSSVTAVFEVPLATLPPAPNPVVNTADLDQSDTLPGNDPNARQLPPDQDTAQIGIPVLQASKSASLLTDADGSGNVSPGDVLRYTVVTSNTGAGPATSVLFEDTPDANTPLVLASVSTTQGDVLEGNSAGDTSILVELGTIAPGSSATVTYDVQIVSPLPAGVTEAANQAVLNTTELPPVDSHDPDIPGMGGPTFVPIIAAPDLLISKDDGGTTTQPGGSVVYTLSYQNVGNQDASGVFITDTVPLNSVFHAAASTPGWVCVPDNSANSTCTLAIGDMAAGAAAASASFAVTVDSPLPAGVSEIVNGVSIADDGSNGDDPNPENNNDSDTTPVTAVPDLLINKDDGGIAAAPGDTVSYTLSYQNVGNQNASGVNITDTVPAHSTFNAGASTPGWSCVPDSNPGSVCTLNVDALAVSVTMSTAVFAVTVNNPLAAGVTGISNSSSIADDGNNGPDPTPGNNSDSDTTPVLAMPDLVISKDDGGATAVPGDTVTYLLSYQNAGNQDATGVTISESVPANSTFNAGASTAGWACVPGANPGAVCTLLIGDLAAGGSATAVFAVTVDDPVPAGLTEIINAASIADDGNNGPDPTPENNSDGDTTPVDATPDMLILKDDGGFVASPGDTVSYSLSYQNVGNQDATGVVISETVPANSTFNAGASTPGWTCAPNGNPGSICVLAVAAVEAGVAAGTATFAVDVDTPLAAGVTEIINGSSIADDGNNGPDPTPENNQDGDTTPVEAAPDMVISKDDGDFSAVPGDTVSYTLSYQNAGDQDATAVVITESVPADSMFNAASSTDGWLCVPDANPGAVCTLAVGDVAAGADPVSVIFAVDVDSPLSAGVSEIVNSASIADDGRNGDDPTPENNSDNDNTPVEAVPDMVITKYDGGEIMLPGETINYTLTYQNVGTQDATGARITETVPQNTAFDAAASDPGWVCTPDGLSGSDCTFDIGDLAAGADPQTVIFAVMLDDPWPYEVLEVLNSASITDDGSNGEDPTPDNNADAVSTQVGGSTTFRVTKHFTDGNPMDVEVTITCNAGLPLTQTAKISEDKLVTFSMTSFTAGEMNCDIAEVTPAGYTPVYTAGVTESGFAEGYSDDAEGCHFEGVAFGGFTCDITNAPDPVQIAIEKDWNIDGSGGYPVDTRYLLTLYCNSEIVEADNECPPIDDLRTRARFGGWCKQFSGDDSAIHIAQVVPTYPSAHCMVIEQAMSSAVEVDNGCLDIEVSAGNGTSCLITNTVFFEGIPTLSQYSLALLGLLMLATGLAGFRRYA